MRKRLWLVVGGVAALVLAGAAAWCLLDLTELARVGTVYTAQRTCACLFISRRTPESCHGDLDPMARWLVSVAIGDAHVTARSLGVGRATSRYQPGFGCALVD
jgi:hypothetical protein